MCSAILIFLFSLVAACAHADVLVTNRTSDMRFKLIDRGLQDFSLHKTHLVCAMLGKGQAGEVCAADARKLQYEGQGKKSPPKGFADAESVLVDQVRKLFRLSEHRRRDRLDPKKKQDKMQDLKQKVFCKKVDRRPLMEPYRRALGRGPGGDTLIEAYRRAVSRTPGRRSPPSVGAIGRMPRPCRRLPVQPCRTPKPSPLDDDMMRISSDEEDRETSRNLNFELQAVNDRLLWLDELEAKLKELPNDESIKILLEKVRLSPRTQAWQKTLLESFSSDKMSKTRAYLLDNKQGLERVMRTLGHDLVQTSQRDRNLVAVALIGLLSGGGVALATLRFRREDVSSPF
eukprot:gnl/TRDRNA2_/TRDRNA2_134802_c0_seq1.p1 gnl/TRDRNA2_/TRDRNA2_134802_c0~~gnl/TRDRNA2_/TRDRNA2_134802_c0_seq1.p1  ORF type:complete len:344 (-),score=53.80 gnl/TRDRNA2_/TRDRNA2_134802_c0_seq1:81-1112(-)